MLKTGLLDPQSLRDYNGHMVKTLRESKAKLSELVELAHQGEDVLITVRGQVKARLTGVAADNAVDMKRWAEDLGALDTYTLKNTLGVEDILEDSREDR